MGLLSHAIHKHSCGSQHNYICATTCTFIIRQVCTIEPSFFKTSGMHRRPFRVLTCNLKSIHSIYYLSANFYLWIFNNELYFGNLLLSTFRYQFICHQFLRHYQIYYLNPLRNDYSLSYSDSLYRRHVNYAKLMMEWLHILLFHIYNFLSTKTNIYKI